MEQNILEAAEKLFLSKGFGLTSTTEIATLAGCNQALVHYYFRTKENLFLQLFTHKAVEFATVFLEVESKGLNFLDRLKARIEAHFDLMVKNPKLPFLLIQEITTNPKRIQALKESIGEIPLAAIQKLTQEIEAEIKHKRIRPITVENLIMNIIFLNAAVFISLPIIEYGCEYSKTKMASFLEERKQEVIRTLIQSLKP